MPCFSGLMLELLQLNEIEIFSFYLVLQYPREGMQIDRRST